jgi:hypothetical protein
VKIGWQTHTVIDGITKSPNGPVHKWRYGNNVMKNFAFDTQHRLTYLSSSYGIQSKYYAYDDSNNIRIISDLRNRSYTQNMAYDRLTQVTSAGIGNQYYSYDNLGNRITRRGNLSKL